MRAHTGRCIPSRKRDVMAAHCQHCAADVSGVAQTALQSYDHIEIPEIKPDVTRVTLHGGLCPCCARRFKATPPQGLEPGSPFGSNLRAFAIYLRTSHAISLERLARLMSDILGLEISEGALVNILDNSRQAFSEQVKLIRAKLLCGSILQSDETGMRVGKKTWWAWVFHHDRECCFVIRPSRGKDVVEEFLGGHRPDFWVSDRLAARWAGLPKSIRSVSPICCATCSTPSMPATISSLRLWQSSCARPVPSAGAAGNWPMPRCAAMPPSWTTS